MTTSEEAVGSFGEHSIGSLIVRPVTSKDPDSSLNENEDNPVNLWAEIHRLRARLQGPAGYATWQEAATAERVKRVEAERKLPVGNFIRAVAGLSVFGGAIECLRDVVSHHAVYRDALRASNSTTGDGDEAYILHELGVLDRMRDQAETFIREFDNAQRSSEIDDGSNG